MHTKLKGDIGQLIAAKEFLRRGWHVAFPYGENMKYDLIIEKEGIMKRVQVKACFPKKGSLRINFRSSNNWSVVQYTKSDFDLVAAVDLESERVYFIPPDKFSSCMLNIRIDQAKNCQMKNINFAENFLQIT